ncbi:hypothetical protein PWP89_13135 [Stenotrophomonas rhizophila]|uniref:hypothetical protein n=1 Tax=Stenotrophomonas rhizophila TaxID=216778 RepID=UPI000B851605|nr:hypothetical protein [Stenotrophomonas rhizophila]
MNVTTYEQFARAQSVRAQAISKGWNHHECVGQLVRAGYSKSVQNELAERARRQRASRPGSGGDAA